jgi:Mg2+ and Co2+ transporter CorA
MESLDNQQDMDAGAQAQTSAGSNLDPSPAGKTDDKSHSEGWTTTNAVGDDDWGAFTLWGKSKKEGKKRVEAVRRPITIHHSTGTASYSEEEDSSVVQVSSGSRDDDYTESEDEGEWDYIDFEDNEIDPSESASRPRPAKHYPSVPARAPQPQPTRRKSLRHQVPVVDPQSRHRLRSSHTLPASPENDSRSDRRLGASPSSSSGVFQSFSEDDLFDSSVFAQYWIAEDGDLSEIVSHTSSDEESDVKEYEKPRPLPAPRTAPRHRITPLDMAGNQLAYPIDTSVQYTGTDEGSSDDFNKANSVNDMESQSLRVLKALHTNSANEQIVQLHVLSGPEVRWVEPHIEFRWYHLHGERLDFSQFRRACLGVPHLTERMRVLLIRSFQKIESDGLRTFLGGMYIEPGTVIRGDETNQDDPQSVIFSCIPYFGVQAPCTPSRSLQDDALHPPRTLMQTYYPYEPVRDRDQEQVFKKFKAAGARSSKDTIHIPSLWVMNIGTLAIVTCGHVSLTDQLGKSIRLIKEPADILKKSSHSNQVGAQVTDPGTRTVRLTDWDGQRFFYTIDECRTYFQVEQKFRELRSLTRHPSGDTIELVCLTNSIPSERPVMARLTASRWRLLISDPDCIFIDITVRTNNAAASIGSEKGDEEEQGRKRDHSPTDTTSQISVSPFLEWSDTSNNENIPKASTAAYQTKIPRDVQRTNFLRAGTQLMHRLEQAERAMISDRSNRSRSDGRNPVISKADYLTLPESQLEQVKSKVQVVLSNPRGKTANTTRSPRHHIIFEDQCSKLAAETSKLVNTVIQTIRLFVGLSDVDMHALLRKVWGALMQITAVIEQIRRYELEEPFANLRRLPGGLRGFTIRQPNSVPDGELMSHLGGNKFKASVKNCHSCRRDRQYPDLQSALKHLRTHLDNSNPEPGQGNLSVEQEFAQLAENWVLRSDAAMVEETNIQCHTVLVHANQHAEHFLDLIQELADGVRIPDGNMAELYTFPPELLKMLQRLVVYYLSVERALHFRRDVSTNHNADYNTLTHRDLTRSSLSALDRFSDAVKNSILTVRKDLCNMARSIDSQRGLQRRALSPEYVCAWMMKGLLVKPVSSSMTTVDLYREYLLRLQFQTNHHPTKRLLRSIHLLQEELSALEQINSWQTNLVHCYSQVLDDQTYEVESQSRGATYPYVQIILSYCLDYLDDVREDYAYLSKRCGPLSESTKQSAEINEEDHGKAILVFTLVTTIFLPLSFVTSYLGMNTSDIRDMDKKQALFWEIAIPLTTLTIFIMMTIAYKGDHLRNMMSNMYDRVTGKEDTELRRGISVAQRKRDPTQQTVRPGSSTILNSSFLGDIGPREEKTPGSTQEADPSDYDYENYGSRTKHLNPRPFGYPQKISANRKRHPSHSFYQHSGGPRRSAQASRPQPPAAAPYGYTGAPFRRSSTLQNQAVSIPQPPEALSRQPYFNSSVRFPSNYPTFPPPPSALAAYHYEGPRHRFSQRQHIPYTQEPYAAYDRPVVNAYSPSPNPFEPPEYALIPAPPQQSNALGDSSHLRIHRHDIEPDSLAFYNIPWEYDVHDPEYYTILRYMSRQEVEGLFNHTTILRAQRKTRRERTKDLNYEDSGEGHGKMISLETPFSSG